MSSSTSTSLTLRALLKTAVTRLGLGVPGRDVSGLTPAAKALFIAAAAVRASACPGGRPDRRATSSRLTSDLRIFLSRRSKACPTRTRPVVLPFPSHEIDPYRGLSPHFESRRRGPGPCTRSRTGTARLVVASGRGAPAAPQLRRALADGAA